MKEKVVLIPNLNYIAKTDSISFNDVAIMLHTSGITSSQKRVMLSHKNLISNVESNIASLRLSSEGKVLLALPMYLGYCNTAQFLSHIYVGAPMVIHNRIFIPKLFWRIVKEKITNFIDVPTMLLMILEYRYCDSYDISSLKFVLVVGR